MAERVTALAAERFPAVELHFHPQCFLSSGHFAGDDAERAAAFVEIANDAVVRRRVVRARRLRLRPRSPRRRWRQLTDAARAKTYLGYSDAGVLLAGLYAQGLPGRRARPDAGGHQPRAAARRRWRGRSSYLATGAAETLEPSVAGAGRSRPST